MKNGNILSIITNNHNMGDTLIENQDYGRNEIKDQGSFGESIDKSIRK